MLYKWRTLGIVAIGSLMGAIDGTVVIIAFPEIGRDLNASLVTMVWVLMVYILLGTALVLSLGRLADMKGRKRLYATGFMVFVAGSALCGVAQTGEWLIAARALQGVGGAMLFANSFALLSDAFPPEERGRAFGLNTVVWATGAIVGIAVGALILSVASWRWIFWINVPIGIVGIFLAFRYLRESVTPNPRDTFDFPAAGLFTGALACILFGITESLLVGWSAPISYGFLVLGLVLLVGFVLWEEFASRDPILPLGLFKNWLFSASLLASVLQGLAIFATNLLLMVYYQEVLGVPVLSAAVILLPLSIALALVSPLGGRLSDRFGARVVSTVGLVIQGIALLLFSTIDPSTPLSAVAGYEAMLGVGGGLFFPANTAAIMGGVDRAHYGVASGVMMTLRNSSMTLSYAFALIALSSALPAGFVGGIFLGGGAGSSALTPAEFQAAFLSGMSLAFHVMAALVFAAAVFSALRGRERRIGEARPLGRRTTVRHPYVYDAGSGPVAGPDGTTPAPAPARSG
jgi:EmrB/QacA subfamily drug resistance transporter